MVLCKAVIACLPVACSSSLLSPVSVPEVQVPEKFAGSAVSGSYDPSEWWKAFSDPTLDRAVEVALSRNFDLAEAVERVNQARARERIADSAGALRIEPSGNIDEINVPTSGGAGAQVDELTPEIPGFDIELPERLTVTTYSISAGFSYEIDFWDRNLNNAQAAGAERSASEWDYHAVRMGIVAEIVRTYLEIAHLRRQEELSGEIVEIFQEREKLTEFRYNQGLDSARDLYRVRRNLWDAEAELPIIAGRLADTERRLWILLGGYREDLADMLPKSLAPAVALEPVPPGIPADLLVQRPDVRAAWQRMEAARYAVHARRAELLPTLSLSGSIGLQTSEREDLFEFNQWFRNLTVNLLGPVFQGSRLRDNVTLAESRLDGAVAAYGRVVVTAVNEVESALIGWETSHRFYILRQSFAEEAQAEVAYQERRYQSGVADYEDFLTASQTFVSANSALAAAERDLGHARLALHRALGGTWVASEPVPARQDGSSSAEDIRPASLSTD